MLGLREQRQPESHAGWTVEPTPDLHGPAPELRALLECVADRALGGVCVEQLGLAFVGKAAQVRQHPGVLGAGFAVGSQSGGSGRRRGRES